MIALVLQGLLAHAGGGESALEDILPLVQWAVPGGVVVLMWFMLRRSAREETRLDGGSPPSSKRTVLVYYEDGRTIEELTATSSQRANGGHRVV